MKKKNKTILTIIICILLLLLVILGISLYRDYLDRETNKILELTDTVYTKLDKSELPNGLYEANIKEDIINYINKLKNKKINSITYKIKDEDFYFQIAIKKQEDDYTFTIEKIVDEHQNIKAQMKLENIEKIEYKTGNANKSTVLKLITDYDSQYLAITNNTYYFLGSDIEEITFKNDHFYYLTYNPNYKTLQTATSCSNAVKNDIDGFSMSDNYYQYGKINFLKDYYQKLTSKKYTVKEKCEELENKK